MQRKSQLPHSLVNMALHPEYDITLDARISVAFRQWVRLYHRGQSKF